VIFQNNKLLDIIRPRTCLGVYWSQKLKFIFNEKLTNDSLKNVRHFIRRYNKEKTSKIQNKLSTFSYFVYLYNHISITQILVIKCENNSSKVPTTQSIFQHAIKIRSV